ncbi:MAG: hypothetical protein IJB83_00475 [Bacilli bacterium]|nr:hypothetical protein [Bacilli bacterium]
MIIKLLMKKNGKLLFGTFIFVFLLAVILATIFITNNINKEILTFTKDGYALYNNDIKESKIETYPFKAGTNYKYNKSNEKISFESQNDKVVIDDATIIHYTDNSLEVMKKVVGIDVNTINNSIIFYYNIFKDTKIEYVKGGYKIKVNNGKELTFKNLLLRITENKFLLTGENVRLVFPNKEIIDFDNYVEFEYTDGNIVKIYNNEHSYKTIASGAYLLVNDIKINLNDAEIYKANQKYITLSNLVIDNNGNIDVIVENPENLDISDGNVELPESGNAGGGTSSGDGGSNNNSGGVIDGIVGDETEDEEEEDNEVIEDETITKKTPQYKLTELLLTALKIDAKIEINDEDGLITSDTLVQIIENSTSKVVAETTASMGDTSIFISHADLKPDTEYTLNARASYKIDDIEYSKTFISKIFRTEDIGVSFEKSYATENLIVVDVIKENYSKVSSVVMELYDENGTKINYQTIRFEDQKEIREVVFAGLDPNTTYLVKMSEILCQGVIVDDGFTQKENITTLKNKITIGSLNYEIDKRNSRFNLNVDTIEDPNYGIKSYRYEIYDARGEITNAAPVLVLSQDNTSGVQVNVDDKLIHRGIPYTYILVVEFYDNEKIIEYSKELGTTMTLEGVEYPSVRFDEESAYITWEQINGTIIIEDPSNAIVSNEYQVIYKNSVDVFTVQTITADSETGNIPITINNLRANETYTFQVYGSINMQDGNETLKSAYIGSVFVQTKNPQPLAAFYANTDNYSDAFSINFKLENRINEDAQLEASTLSEVTFTLYQGATTEGSRQVYKRILDSDDLPYISTLKRDFYDKNAIINPAFFDSKNGDFTEKTYTLEISKAYDYTDFKNEIPIENNIYTFQTNSYIPDLPEDYNDAVNVSTITNRNATSFGLEYDSNLENNITVGYRVTPKFNNESKSARRIIWHVWRLNPTTNEYEMLPELDKTLEFNEDGTLDPAIFKLDYGTPKNILDSDTMRRGNYYHFSYEIFIDVDKDGEEDTHYPKKYGEDIILTSKDLIALKQEANVKMYPSISTNNTYTWKYKIKDIDNSLETNKLYSYLDSSTSPTSSPTIIVGAEEYNAVEFTKLTPGKNIIIKKHESLIKNNSGTYDILTQQYFTGTKDTINLSYSVVVDVNKMIISINDYYDNFEVVKSIASLDVEIIPRSPEDQEKYGTMTIKGLQLDNDTIVIDFFELHKYLSVDIMVNVTAYYDSGIMGFDSEAEYFAMQKVDVTDSIVYYIYDGSNMTQNSSIKKSMYKKSFDELNETLSLTHFDTQKDVQIPIEINNTGVIYDGNNIVLKQLNKQKLTSTQNIVRFDLIIPGISMLDSSNKTNIRSLLDSAEVNAKIINLDTVVVENDLIYIELYKTDENGTNAQYIRTFTETITAFLGPVVITDLLPETNYYIQFYTYVYNNDLNQFEKRYLYDIDQQAHGIKYRFYTLSKVGITNVKANMTELSYENKYINITYNLDTIYGFDHIEYTLYKIEDGKYIETKINIPNSSAFFTSMELKVGATPKENSEIYYGGKYAIKIKPVGYYESNGELVEIDLGTVTHEFEINKPEDPYIGITTSKNATSINFRVSVFDPNFIIANGTYDVKLVDQNYNVIATILNQPISLINKNFSFSNTKYNLIDNDLYTFVVTVNLDRTNLATDLDQVTETKNIYFGDFVNLGTVTTSKNVENPKNIDIIFSDPYKLNTIDSVQYTITSNEGFYLSKRTEFITRYDPDKLLYYYTIEVDDSVEFIENSLYTITLNLYSGNTLATQTELNYYYTLSGGTTDEEA